MSTPPPSMEQAEPTLIPVIKPSQRELEVLKLLADDIAAPTIATRLQISYHTVRTHQERIREKLQVRAMPAAVAIALRHHWID